MFPEPAITSTPDAIQIDCSFEMGDGESFSISSIFGREFVITDGDIAPRQGRCD